MSVKLKNHHARLNHLLSLHNISLVLDVGANVGQYATHLRENGYQNRIVSFEPQSHVHSQLSQVAAGDANWLIAPRMALGSQRREVLLNVFNNTDMSSLVELDESVRGLLSSDYPVKQEPVEQQRLDEVLHEFAAPDDRIALKVDTQGFEKEVLAGAAGVLERISMIQLELSVIPVYKGETLYLEMISELQGLGFVPCLFIPGYFNARSGQMLQMDGVFVRESLIPHVSASPSINQSTSQSVNQSVKQGS